METQIPRKKFLFFALVFFGGIWFAKTLANNSQSIVNLTDADSGKVVNIVKGKTFTLTLPDHIDGGYRFDPIRFDPTIIILQKSTSTPPALSSPRGRSGTRTWRFIAKAAGQSAIKVTATRPWKGGGTVALFENKVIVK